MMEGQVGKEPDASGRVRKPASAPGLCRELPTRPQEEGKEEMHLRRPGTVGAAVLADSV